MKTPEEIIAEAEFHVKAARQEYARGAMIPTDTLSRLVLMCRKRGEALQSIPLGSGFAMIAEEALAFAGEKEEG